MSFEATANALRDHFKDAWTIVEEHIPIEFEGVDFSPPDPNPSPAIAEGEENEPAYLRFTMLDGDGRQVSFGASRRWRNVGVLVVSIFTPLGAGDGRARELADEAATILRGITVSGVTLQAPGLRRIGKSGPWLQHNLNTPYFFDQIA